MNFEGRRVENVEALERDGDYCLKYANDGIESMWFVMPGFGPGSGRRGAPCWNRIGGPTAPEDQTRWEISEDEQGRVTVDPSILSQWTWGEDQVECRFHCFLKGGVFEILDDTTGAVFPESA